MKVGDTVRERGERRESAAPTLEATPEFAPGDRVRSTEYGPRRGFLAAVKGHKFNPVRGPYGIILYGQGKNPVGFAERELTPESEVGLRVTSGDVVAMARLPLLDRLARSLFVTDPAMVKEIMRACEFDYEKVPSISEIMWGEKRYAALRLTCEERASAMISFRACMAWQP